MRITLLFVVLLSSAVSVSAGLVSSTRCETVEIPKDPVVISAPGGCVIGMTPAELDQDISVPGSHRAGSIIRTSLDFGLDLHVRSQVQAWEMNQTANTTTEFDWTFWLVTDGTPRPGKLVTVGFGDLLGQSTFQLNDGNAEVNVWLDGAPFPSPSSGIDEFDITLGQPLEVRVQGSTFLSTSFNQGPRWADLFVSLSFSALEEDGTENFSIRAVSEPIPEPATLSLFAAGLAVLWLRRRR